MNLREEKGYTYGAYSRVYAKRLGGSFEATSEVRTSVTGDSLKEFFYELNRIRDEKSSEQELNDAKNYLTGVFPIRAETQGGLTGLIVSQLLYNLPEDYLETYRDKINDVTLADVERVANKYISPDKIAMVIVGDAEEVLPQAKSYTDNIEIFDTEGNKLDIEKYSVSSDAETANVSGNWTLTLEVMGQEMNMNLVLEQDGENISGKVESMIGEGVISDGKVNGNKFSAVANTEFQRQKLELGIKGAVKGDSMSGIMSAPIIPAPLEFKGVRV
jgi:zinc protease